VMSLMVLGFVYATDYSGDTGGISDGTPWT
jgi:hypothetical protein